MGPIGSWQIPHLEMGIRVTFPNLLQQFPAGLSHRASCLQQILPRLEVRKRGTRQLPVFGLVICAKKSSLPLCALRTSMVTVTLSPPPRAIPKD